MEKKFDVCCVGHMCTDVLIRPVNELPRRGELALVQSVHVRNGGCAMNTAIGLARLGIKTAMAGKVGDDEFGSFLSNVLQKEGVNTRGLLKENGAMTSASVVTIDNSGERSILHCLGTNGTLCYEDIPVDIVMQSKILFIGGTLLLPRFDGTDAARLLKEAQAAGVITAMDTAWDASGRWMEAVAPALAYLDWFLPSVEEAEQLVGTRDPEKLCRSFSERGVKNIVIKMGEDGCLVKPQGEEAFIIPVYPAEKVDTAGAGDAWCAGFLAGLVKKCDAEFAAKLGNAVGAQCITEAGTTAGLKSYGTTLRFMAENDEGDGR